MRKTYPEWAVAKFHRISYAIHMSKENHSDMIRRITRDTCTEDVDDYVSHLDLCEFIQRWNDKLIFTERYEDGVRVQQMTDESGTFSYHVEGRMHSFLQGFDVIYTSVDVFSTGEGADPEALCVAIEATYTGTKVYYATKDFDGSGYRTNSKDNRFKALPYSYGYSKAGHNRGETSDDIEDACELMKEIGFNGEHTEQALLEFVEHFPISKEGDYVWFNKLEVVE